jgi:CheY-like chemotaxis protein
MLEKKKIMLVDDDEDITIALKLKLENTNKFNTVITNQGSLAVRLAMREQPDLIICDINMPDLSGGEVAFELSQIQDTKHIPIIFLSSLLSKEESGEDGKLSGINPVLSKGVPFNLLIKKIDKMLSI